MSSSSDRKTRSQKSREGHNRYRPAEQTFVRKCLPYIVDCIKTLALGFVDCFAKQNTTYIRKAVDRIVMTLRSVRSDSNLLRFQGIYFRNRVDCWQSVFLSKFQQGL